jgi:hypothetical protein
MMITIASMAMAAVISAAAAATATPPEIRRYHISQ